MRKWAAVNANRTGDVICAGVTPSSLIAPVRISGVVRNPEQ
ncbi:hypothetical protein [Corynebacterium antarcticum]|nr:hypothetical protein [Corynebacterium antarcticum]